MTHKTLEVNSIPIPPHLAGQLKRALGRSGTGFDEGAFLQQLHFWTLNRGTTGWIIDGVKWIYNSLKAWQEQFPWMSEYALRKAISNLKKLGLIQTAQHWIHEYKRVMFYRIDYERLATFAGDVCDLITTRPVNSDLIDVPSDPMTNTEISSKTSSSEQLTSVVFEEEIEMTHSSAVPPDQPELEVKPLKSGVDNISAPGSGKQSKSQGSVFPELMDAVAEAIGQPLPPALQTAVAQFPGRVQKAIAYLQQQQQRRLIANPIGYLYWVIVEGWERLATSESTRSEIPAGFTQWFDRARAQGLVIAATTINGVHHTLHTGQGWVPTRQMMQKYPLLLNNPNAFDCSPSSETLV